jgi:hypothetical protein
MLAPKWDQRESSGDGGQPFSGGEPWSPRNPGPSSADTARPRAMGGATGEDGRRTMFCIRKRTGAHGALRANYTGAEAEMTVQLPTFTVNLHEAARRSESETREWTADKLDAAIERYRKFFALAGVGGRVAPTREIDMIWHLHMLAPVAYYNDCMAYLGRILDHDGGFGQTPDEVEVLAGVFAETAARWQDVYGEPYVPEAQGPTKCWHDCSGRCWHACSSNDESDALEIRALPL